MRRLMLSLAGLALVVIAMVGAAPTGATGATGAAPRADLRGVVCHNALDPADRSMSVTAVMRPVAGTQKLQLKFDLWVAENGAPSTKTRARNLGVWFTPKNPTLGQLPGDVWNFKKYVVQLDAPAVYQFRVSFRWLGSDGQVLSTAQRSTKRCRQRELRPDLMVVSPIDVTPTAGHPNRDTYTAAIRNGGATAAGPFLVGFLPPNASTEQTVTIQRLRPHTQQTVSFVGPLCSAAGPPEIIADPSDQVSDDFNPANNSLYATCPSANGS